MPKSIFSGAHKHLVNVLIEARRESGMTQAQLAAAVGKDQSFISIIEGSQRRVDVLEFCKLARAMGQDPTVMFGRLAAILPDDFAI